MRLALPDPDERYRSGSQRARVATEAWAHDNLYCPRCTRTALVPHVAGRKVSDFWCDRCELEVQLKAKRGTFGPAFANSAYEPKIAAIRNRTLPDYALLSYDLAAWSVTDLRILPGHFVTEASVFARRPLSESARRVGWVGSTVRLADLPPVAFVPVVEAGRALPPTATRRAYARFEFLRETSSEQAGWLADTLMEVTRLASAGEDFTLAQLYEASEATLAARHPANRNIRAKMRQQLQVLRDRGALEFVRPGVYRLRSVALGREP